MKKNPVIPYAIIAIIGLLLVIVVSFVGLDQQKAIEEAENGGGEKQEQSAGDTTDPEAIFQQNCASCHGADLTGGVGPDLTQVGSRLSEEEIKNVIINGKGNMPAGLVPTAQAEALAKWLAEKK